MLDQMSGGRFQLGVGRGVSMYETAAYGLDFAKTQAMYHEAFQVLLKGLTSDELSVRGQVLQVRQAADDPASPLQRPHPPLWYGVTCRTTPTGRRRTTSTSSRSGLRANTSAIIERYRAARAKHGFDPDGTLVGVSRHVVVADTDEAALRDRAPRLSALARELPLAVRPPRHRAARHRHLSADLRRTARSSTTACAGSPETVRRFIAQRSRRAIATTSCRRSRSAT